MFKGDFYEAAIEMDMILSYPWLRENRLGVFPHRNALAMDEPNFQLVMGKNPKKSKKFFRDGKKCKASEGERK